MFNTYSHNCFQSPVTIQVQVPNTDKSEWKLNGQMIAITLALTDPIANLKAKLQDETGMPPAKQKIFYEVSKRRVSFIYILKTIVFVYLFRVCSSKIVTQWPFITCLVAPRYTYKSRSAVVAKSKVMTEFFICKSLFCECFCNHS